MADDDTLLTALANLLVSSAGKIARAGHSRRAFLTGVGAALLLPRPSWADTGTPSLRWTKRGLNIRFRGLGWDLDREEFGRNARLRLVQRRAEFVIQMSRAILPGTDLRTDFALTLFKRAGRWMCNLDLPSLSFSATGLIADWLKGEALTGTARPVSWVTATGTVRTSSGPMEVRCNPNLRFAFLAETKIDGQIQASGCGLSLDIQPRDKSLAAWLAPLAGRHFTSFKLLRPVMRPRAFAMAAGNDAVAIRYFDPESIGGEFIETQGGRRQVAIISGRAGLDVVRSGSVEPLLLFDHAATLITPELMAVTGTIADEVFRVGLRSSAAELRGRLGSREFKAVFRPGHRNDVEAELDVQAVLLPLADGDYARILTGRSPARLLAAGAKGEAPGSPNLAIQGGSSSTIPLEGNQVHLHRGADLLDLTFAFSGFELKHRWTGAAYLRRVRKHGFCEPATITLLLPPQHLGETAIRSDLPGCPALLPIETSIAERSRIVFKLPRLPVGQSKWRSVPLSIAALTNWDDLEEHQSVSPRAAAGDDLDSQLKAVNLGAGPSQGSVADAFQTIEATLVAPAPDQSLLALADEFIFSTGPRAKFDFPGRAPDKGSPLFGIRIGHRSDPRLRAIWSRRLPERTLPPDLPKDRLIERAWGVVSQTAIFGLPALRRLAPSDASGPIDSALALVPSGGVVRPAKPAGYLLEIDDLIEQHRQKAPGEALPPSPPPETGIALAKTFDLADVTMTPLGATMRIDLRTEPPIFEPVPGLPKASRYIAQTAQERLFYSTYLERDEEIIDAKKGFLLPLGFRATRLETQKRAYVPDPDRPGGTIAVDLIRTRIVTRRPVKSYPALNQPDAGRDWPVTKASLLTDITPPLINPETVPDPLKTVRNKFKIDQWTVFWPQFHVDKVSTAHVDWKVQIDADATPMTSRMIFVEGDVIAAEDIVAAAVEVYNAAVTVVPAPWPASNTAKLFGARRRYADAKKPEDTSFDTDSWLLAARGRSVGTGDFFIMDARMNGADQPPFYPSIRRTKVSVQSIDRLVGAPQGLIECQPDPVYVRDGFTGVNDPEIFLDVVRPEISFSLTGLPSVSVGVAQPTTMVAALSRSRGVIGGAQRTAGQSGTLLADSSSTDLALDFGTARSNKFSVREWFNNSLVILGVDLIGLVIDQVVDGLSEAPKLIEQFSYGVDETAGSALERIRSIAAAAADAADKLFGVECGPPSAGPCGLDAAIAAADAKLVQAHLSFAILYPDFSKAYLAARQAIPAALREIAAASGFAEVTTGASDTTVAARPFIAATEALIENPVPQVFEQVIDIIKHAWDNLQKAVRAPLRQLLGSAIVPLFEGVVVPTLAAATPDELELCFGIAVAKADIEKVLLDPSARTRMAQAYLYDQFGAPLVHIVEAMSELLVGLEGRILIERTSLEAGFAATVAQAAQTIQARLDPMAAASIAVPAVQAQLAADLLSIVDAALAPLQPTSPDASAIAAELDQVQSRLEGNVRGRFSAAIAGHPEMFPPVAGDTAVAIIKAFVAATGDQLTIATGAVAKAAVDRAEALVQQYALQADKQAGRVAGDFLSLLTSIIGLGALPRLTRAAAAISDWCSSTGPATRAGVALGASLLGDASEIIPNITEMLQKVALVPGPTSPPQVAQAFEAARKDFLAAASELRSLATALERDRAKVLGFQHTNACTMAASFVRAVEDATRSRIAALPALARLLSAFAAMTSVAQVSPLMARPGMLAPRPTLNEVGNIARKLLADITTIGRAGTSAQWADIRGAVDDLKANLSGFSDLLTEVEGQIAKIEQEAGDFRKALGTATAAELVEIARKVAGDYVLQDRRLSALILQTVAFSNATLQQIDAAELRAIQVGADGLSKFEGAIADAGDAVNEVILKSDVLTYLISLAGVDDLPTVIGNLRTEANALGAVSHAATSDDATTLLDPIIARWKSGDVPLVALFQKIVALVDIVFQGNLTDLVAGDVRRLANELKDELADVIKQFIPTSVETGYDWSTRLGESRYFKIEDPNGSDKHLTLSSRVEYDFVKKTSVAQMMGELAAFAIMLPEMATIHFTPAKFSGGTGQKTKFDVNVVSVELGPYLEFLDALRSWMSPSGNGIYVRPTFDNIQVGYQFASDLIMCGDLEFMNIAIDVYARLPFGPGGAKFGFNFASEERPFTIACVPYGGGGYLLMEMDAAGSLEGLTLSFLFGAVVAFQFGFLSGSGRVSAGFALTQRNSGSEKGLTVQAIVEAVGEGHIACFSLTIFIRIVCTHSPGGSLDGTATYKFSFKIGFFSVHYAVTANRHIAGSHKGNESSANARVALIKAGPKKRAKDHFTIGTSAPVKNRAWGDYRSHVALDLIDEAW